MYFSFGFWVPFSSAADRENWAKKRHKNLLVFALEPLRIRIRDCDCGRCGGWRYLASIIVSSAAVPMSTLAHWRHRSSGPSPKVEQHVLPSSGKSDLTRFVCGCHCSGCFLWSAMTEDAMGLEGKSSCVADCSPPVNPPPLSLQLASQWHLLNTIRLNY